MYKRQTLHCVCNGVFPVILTTDFLNRMTLCWPFVLGCVSGKLLLMLQSVKRGHAVDPHHPEMHECIVRFLKTGKEINQCSIIVKGLIEFSLVWLENKLWSKLWLGKKLAKIHLPDWLFFLPQTIRQPWIVKGVLVVENHSTKYQLKVMKQWGQKFIPWFHHGCLIYAILSFLAI